MFSSQNSQVSSAANYIEDVFSTYLYTGNGSTQTITNGINLSTNGGLVWAKMRSNGSATGHVLSDTARGPSQKLDTSSTGASSNWTPYGISAFGSTGFTVADDGAGNYVTNNSGVNYVSWTFRKQAKFFDVVTYTGNGANRTIAHNLGSVPGCIMVKRTNTTGDWQVYHRSLANTQYMVLNAAGAATTGATRWNSTTPTSTVFSLGTDASVNASGSTYVAYLFAHDAGGFGLTGTDNVISCGSYTGNGTGGDTGGPIVTLGYEPQWVLIKNYSASNTNSWVMMDTMRGLQYGNDSPLWADLSDAEQVAQGNYITPLADGFQLASSSGGVNNLNKNFIYIAIRRGPMKVPTSGTDVFLPKTRTGNGTAGTVVTGASWPMDALWISRRTGGGAGVGGFTDIDRLRGAYLSGANPLLRQSQTDAESTTYTTPGFVGEQTSYDLPSGAGYGLFNTNAVTYIDYLFRRSPSVFDEVCYTGTGSARTVTHNLGVAPEMMIVKVRDSATDWAVYHSGIGATKRLILNLTDTPYTSATAGWNDTAPTASVFTVGTNVTVNGNGYLYVAYLFATCAGVSKVFSYTGNGSSQTINCGFTGGARWILIKRTDSTGDWYVWDSARGIVSGNDPYLLLNSTAAEVTTDDTIDTDSTGFVVNQVSATNVNVSSATYIGIAIA